MKVYILSKNVISEKGGTQLYHPQVFTSKVDAEKSLLDDKKLEKDFYKHDLEDYIIIEECDIYQYTYRSSILGFTRIEYKIWENEL